MGRTMALKGGGGGVAEQRAADSEDNGVLRPKVKTGRDVRRKSGHSSVADGTIFSWHLARRGSGRMGF